MTGAAAGTGQFEPVGAWEAVVATALVGTDRRSPPPRALEGLGVDLDAAGPEQALLAEAAVLATRRAAGWMPGASPAAWEPAPYDGRPPASATAVQVLELLLGGEVPLPGGPGALVVEWVTAAARAGRRPPPRLLPALLDLGATRPEARDAVRAVAGARGRWLAARNPAWAGSLGDGATPAEVRFATGTGAEREDALGELRAADPARARELVAATWKAETAAVRAAFLLRLRPGLGPDDDVFLEAALDDRAKSVRTVAAELLDALPSSARAARMAARLEPLVRTGGIVRHKLAVALPGEPDQAARRDGITDDAPPGLGLRAWWLVQIVAAAPLELWSARTGIPPADLVGQGVAPEVELGWVRAAVSQGDATWARLLLRRRPEPGLLAVLPAAEAAEVATTVASSTHTPAAVLSTLLGVVPGPWPAPLSRTAVERYRQATPAEALPVLPLLAARLDPSSAPLVEGWAGAATTDHTRRAVAGLHHALTLRGTIHEELS